MRIALIGHGWIAGKMAQALEGHELTRLTHLNAAQYIKAEIPRRPIDWIVNCAGLTGSPNVDQCERDKAQTIEANTVFPIRIAELAHMRNFRFAHFSSGCIFQGGEFSEDDEPNFDGSTYSASKLVSDQALKNTSLVLRIRMPFDNTEDPKNLLVKLRQYASKSKILDGLNSLSDADEMCAQAAKLIRTNAPNGAYHLVNQGPIWTHEIMDMLGIECRWWDRDEFRSKFPAQRSECQLSTKLQTSLVRDALSNAIERLKVAA